MAGLRQPGARYVHRLSWRNRQCILKSSVSHTDEYKSIDKETVFSYSVQYGACERSEHVRRRRTRERRAACGREAARDVA
jgi:hypothetical protein